MASDWPIQKLGQSGVALIDCDHRTPPAAESGLPYVAIPQMKEGRLDLSGVRRISPEHFVEWTKKAKPQEHDVVLSRRCNPGVTAHVPAGLEMALGQNLVLLRADGKKVHPPFLRWLVSGHEWWDQVGKFINVGAVFESLRCRDIPGFELTLPPLSEQKRIAHILGTLDDKIELNRRMNATLEAMARALFQSWFGDFDPVRRNAEGGESRPEDALFPDAFEDADLGEIPKGWQVAALGEVIDVLETGRRPKGGVAAYKSGVPSIGAESIWGIGQFDYSKTKFIPTEFYEKTSAGRVEHNDVLLYKDGGKPGEFKPRVGLFGHGFPFDKFCINEHVFRMRSDSVGQIYLYFAVSDQRVLADFANKGGKAAIPGINQVDVRSTKILMPDPKILNAFNLQVTPWCDLIIRNAIQSRTLANLRDTLLPKLLSGDVTTLVIPDLSHA